MRIREQEECIKVCFITAYELYYEILKKEFHQKKIELQELIKRIKEELELQ